MAVAIIAMLLSFFHVPAYTRFFISLSEMNAAAVNVCDAPENATHPDRLIGLYSASRIKRIPGGMSFTFPSFTFIDEIGFAYLPNGPQGQSPGPVYFTHWYGDWYIYYVPF